MKKDTKRILAILFGLAVLGSAVPSVPAHADEAEPCAVHTYSFDCDTTCNVCGHERKTEHTYDRYGQNFYYHWPKCECGLKLDMEAHQYDGSADLTCNICGYERHLEHDYSIPGSDGIFHWTECSCGAKSKQEAHVFTAKSDDIWHWQECECGVKMDMSAHVWGEGRTEGDSIYYDCTVCQAQKQVANPQGGNTGEGSGENPGEGTGEGSGENPGEGTGEGTGENPGEGTGEGTGENPGEGSSEENKDDDKEAKGNNASKWLFGAITGIVVLWGGALAGYMVYQKKKGNESVKESKEEV